MVCLGTLDEKLDNRELIRMKEESDSKQKEAESFLKDFIEKFEGQTGVRICHR